jgi:hypothetical protein
MLKKNDDIEWVRRINPLCQYCGGQSHETDECASKLECEGRWNEAEWGVLRKLKHLENDALRYGLRMSEIPEAVELFKMFGRKYNNST